VGPLLNDERGAPSRSSRSSSDSEVLFSAVGRVGSDIVRFQCIISTKKRLWIKVDGGIAQDGCRSVQDAKPGTVGAKSAITGGLMRHCTPGQLIQSQLHDTRPKSRAGL